MFHPLTSFSSVGSSQIYVNKLFIEFEIGQNRKWHLWINLFAHSFAIFYVQSVTYSNRINKSMSRLSRLVCFTCLLLFFIFSFCHLVCRCDTCFVHMSRTALVLIGLLYTKIYESVVSADSVLLSIRSISLNVD